MKRLSLFILLLFSVSYLSVAQKESSQELTNFFSYFESEKDTVNMIKVLKQGVKNYPEEPYFATNLMAVYLTQKKYSKGMSLMKKMVRKVPAETLYQYLYGQMNEAYGYYEKAENNYLQALALDPQNVNAMSGMGSVYYRRGLEKIEEGRKEKMAEDLALNSAKPSFTIALQYLEKALSYQSDNLTVITYLTDIYKKTGDTTRWEDMQRRLKALDFSN